jgi:rRNA biogenesis protein RRP5
LTDKALFVDVSGSVQGVVFPLHYADIKLKHPEKRFKAGQSVKCRVFSVEPEKGRVKLTLKKSLVEATETIPLGFDDVKVDMVTPGLITKVFEKGCLVELFSGIVAYVPLAEVSDAFITDLKTAVFEGKPVKVKITSVDRESQKMFASIRQALPSNLAAAAIQIDDVVSGEVVQIHQDQIVLKLLPSQRKAILALGNLAHHRGVKIAALKTSLKVGEKLDDLVVVVKSDDTGLIIVANKQKPASIETPTGLISKGINMSNLKPGQVVPARVTKKNAQGYFLSITRNVVGRLHPTDMADDFGKLPEINQGDIVKCCVIKVDAESRQLDLSTRPSRVDAAGSSGKSIILDREIESLSDLKKGQKIRGIVKNITGSGLYVSLGRNVTARVMIKEMFDDYVADWQSRFEKGQVVEGKLLSVDAKKEQVEMSLKKKASKAKEKKSSAGLADFQVEQKVDAIVRKVEDYGIFLKIDGTDISGLCHRSEIADDKRADVAQAMKSFRSGDKLKAKITAIDTEANKISFGIKPSYFDAEDFGLEKDDEENEAEASEDGDMDADEEADGDVDEDEGSVAENGFMDLEAEDDDEEDEDDEEEEEEMDDEDEEVDDDSAAEEGESESEEEDVSLT